jgi:hypothetical protein
MTDKDKRFREIYKAYKESGAPIGMQEIMRMASEAGFSDEEIAKEVSKVRSKKTLL